MLLTVTQSHNTMKSFISFNLFIFTVAVFLNGAAAAVCHPDDEAALLALKAGITHDPAGIFSSLKKGTDCCESWIPAFCNSENRVYYVYLNGESQDGKTSLSGTIPSSLPKLEYLELFTFKSFTNITGSFPQFLLQHPKLKSIDIADISLSGPLPTNIGMLSQLETFIVGGNRFTGSIPSSLSKMPLLSILNMEGNLLTGTIPKEFANLKNLDTLNLGGNHLSGSIPDIFKSKTNLRSLRLSCNKFSGELPPSIASLNPSSLKLLELGHNKLYGSFPSYLSRFQTLQILDLSWNQFTGVVPKSCVKLTNLTNIDLSHNLLTGSFPVLNAIGMETLDLSYNKFHMKKIPKWVTLMSIGSLKLAKCGIKMSLDDWNPKENSFYGSLDLSENKISGSPERILKKNSQLKVFRASGNKLRFDMGKLKFSTSLETLDLSRNLVFGKVPATVAGLQTLNLSQNHLCGKLPVTKFPANAFAGNNCLCGSPLPPCKV